MELTTQWSTFCTKAVWGLKVHVSGWIGYITYFMLHGKSLPTLKEKLLLLYWSHLFKVFKQELQDPFITHFS